MKPRKSKFLLIPIVVMVLWGISPPPHQTAYADDFTADLTAFMLNSDVAGKLYVTDEQYRMDLNAPAQTKEKGPVIIVNRAQKKTHLLNPNTQTYDTFDTFSFQAYMADPFQTITHLEQTVEKRKTGATDIAGYSCDHYEFYDQGFKLADVWYAQTLGHFPLKAHIISGRKDGAVDAKTNMKDVTLELGNIQKAPMDKAFFEVPREFSKAEHPDTKQKKAAAGESAISNTLKGTAPWGRRIEKGGELQVKTNPRRPVSITLDDLADTSICTYAAIPQGKTFYEVEPKRLTLPEKGKRRKVTIEKHKQTDWVVIRVDEGLVYAKVINEKDPFSFNLDEKYEERYLTVKELQGFATDPERKLTLTVTGDSQDTPASEVILKCYRDDYKNKVFEETVQIKNGDTKIWEFLPDQQIRTCDIAVGETGAIKVKMEQPAQQKKTPSQMPVTSSAKTNAPKGVYTKPIKPTATARQNQAAGPNKAAQIKKVEKALFSGDVVAVEACLDEGMDPNEMINSSPFLQKAVEQSTAEMVKLIIARGGDLSYKDRLGNNLLFCAQSNNRHFQAVIPVLVEAGVPVDQNTPIWKIAYKTEGGTFKPGVKQTLEYLLSKGADLNTPISKSGNTLLMFAAKMAWLEPVAFYLDHGATVNAKDNKGNTALSWAKTERNGEQPYEKENRKAIIALLESKGAK